MKPVARLLLVAVALAMLGYRLAQVELAPFARDEPQFLAAARDQLRTGQWLAANPLYGNMGVRYGATAFWFYGIVQLVFGDGPRTAIVAMGVLVSLAHLAFAWGVTRLLKESAEFFAVLLAWMASSPYQFQWSRLAWDLTSNAGAFAAVALLCASRELRPPAAIALGVTLGLAVSTHPMVLPLLIAVVFTLVWETRSRPRRLATAVGLVLASAVAVNIPYLLFLSRAPIVPRTPRVALPAADLARLVLQAPRIATSWGIDFAFAGAWPDFQARLGAAAGALDVFSIVAVMACLALGVAGVCLAVASPDERQRRVGRAAAVAWGGTVLLLAVLGLDLHPHYNFSSAWVPVFGVAAVIAWLRRRNHRQGTLALGLLGMMALAQFMVIVSWMGYIRDRGGTRGSAYGTPVGLQMEAMRAVCSVPDQHLTLRNETDMFPFPFQYLATTEAACRGKEVRVCAPYSWLLMKQCPAPVQGGRQVRLGYARGLGGALRVD